MGFSEGELVQHKVDGQGRIKRIIYIDGKVFNGIERHFDTKSAITKGFIKKYRGMGKIRADFMRCLTKVRQ